MKFGILGDKSNISISDIEKSMFIAKHQISIT